MTGLQLSIPGAAPSCARCGVPIHRHTGPGRPRKHCADCRAPRQRRHDPCVRPRPDDRVLLSLFADSPEPIPVVVVGRSWEPASRHSGQDRVTLVRFRTADGLYRTCELSFWRQFSRPMETA